MADKQEILLGGRPLKQNQNQPEGAFVELMGETYYRIANYDQMPPFFMSLVSSADHWLFIGSTGGLTAGRINADSALFPYETEDKIIAHSEQTGSKTLIRVNDNGRSHLWEPFSNRYAGIYHIERHLYKNNWGNKLVFEAVNHDLNLRLRTIWRTGDRFGFIKSTWIQNEGRPRQIDLLDGFQNILPYGATAVLQNTMSSLLHAYKRSEREPETGLGLFTLSATLSDRAEPSESLKATVVWQSGLEPTGHILSAAQLDDFRYGRSLTPEDDICGQPGAYLVQASFELGAGEQKLWHFTADVNQTPSAITSLIHFLGQDEAAVQKALEADIEQGTADLIACVAAADGLQHTARQTTTTHHFANVLFNIMRGGIFANGYQLDKGDLLDFVTVRNRDVLTANQAWFAALPDQMTIGELYEKTAETNSPSLMRLAYEYIPLTFSRRHGDPSRPWNYFSINLKQPDGSPRLDYQGNWRDIFQNWEPLALAFPNYIEGLIAKFLNATTADGYNPYRVTRAGIEWEVPEPDNPWSNIGYWSDHQIIYLQKLLEIGEATRPDLLGDLYTRPIFACADVPYRLRPYAEMLDNWSETIEFDWDKARAIETAVSRMGTDGRLIRDAGGQVVHVTMTEKLLTLLLAKLANLVPEGGIWMNTQRPEWNDANNALVGKGLSVVTTAYLRRFIAFWLAQLAKSSDQSFCVNEALGDFFTAVHDILTANQSHLAAGFSNQARRTMMDALGQAASRYRQTIYDSGLPDQTTSLERQTLGDFLRLAQDYIEETLRANRRTDGLYQAYNILHLEEEANGAGVEHLYLMLEGQVAILSSGLLTPEESLALLQQLRQSDLYRADQHSYMLYPYRQLPGFRQKNNVAAEQIAGSKLAAALKGAGDIRLLVEDEAGVWHFNSKFRNANDAAAVLDTLAGEGDLAELAAAERKFILDLFETTFNHKAFTGRSGTFFAYEGLGSIYWHMVSKLLLAAQESYQTAVSTGAETAVIEALAAAYYDIRQGLSFNKTPDVYGAFPTDPYSHTPWGNGARQPGMTGQVKEEILTRWGELGVSLQEGVLQFRPTLLERDEFLTEPDTFTYCDLGGQFQTLSLPAHSLAFTFCQVPVIYTLGQTAELKLVDRDGRSRTIPGSQLDRTATRQLFDRTGQISHILATVTDIHYSGG